MTQWFVRW